MLVGDFATLKVETIKSHGALLDWGRARGLYLPRAEQIGNFREGDHIVVYITHDHKQVPMATMKLRNHLQHDSSELEQNQKVDLLVVGASDLGFECIIDRKHTGILYHNEVFQDIDYGQSLTGYVKKIRSDGKVDLMSQLRGTSGTADLGEQIMTELGDQDGFLPLNDKSSPAVISDLFGVSKKKFKMALGKLYKERKITIDQDGIRVSD